MSDIRFFYAQIFLAVGLSVGTTSSVNAATRANYAEMATAVASMATDMAANHYALKGNAKAAAGLKSLTDGLSLGNKGLFFYNNIRAQDGLAAWEWDRRDSLVNGLIMGRDVTRLAQHLYEFAQAFKDVDQQTINEASDLAEEILQSPEALAAAGLAPEEVIATTDTTSEQVDLEDEAQAEERHRQHDRVIYLQRVIVLPLFKGLSALAIACTQNYTTSFSSNQARFTATAAHALSRLIEEYVELKKGSWLKKPVVIAMAANLVWLAYEAHQYEIELVRQKGETRNGVCRICDEEQQLQVLACNHAYCNRCMNRYVQTQFTNYRAQMDHTRCPHHQCLHHFTRNEIENAVQRNAQEQRIIQAFDAAAYERANPPRVAELDPEMRAMIDRVEVRICPQCRNGVQRIDGCNHMTCRCRCEFCYACGTPYNPLINGGRGWGARACACPRFPD